MTVVRRDADVPGFVDRLGIPGLVDVHVHFMPDRVLRKVWAFFDDVRTDGGEPGWPIHYRVGQAERVDILRRLGVVAFPSLLYPHKAGMAEWLNGWAAGFAAAVPDAVHSATFFPEEHADGYVAEALDGGARIFKVHLQVGAYDPRDRLLRPVWRRLAAAGVPVVTHAGSGPHPGRFTGPGPITEVLNDHPELTLVIAHMGAPEYEDFLGLAARYPRVHLDTTMAFTGFMERLAPFPRHLVERLAAHPDRIVLGSDFPNIPYAYAHQLEVLEGLGIGDEWLRAVCHDNGARVLGLGG